MSRIAQFDTKANPIYSFVTQHTNEIKIIAHSFAIPFLLVIATHNILYSFVYVLFTSFIYTKVSKNHEVGEAVLFANKIWLTITVLFALLIAIATLTARYSIGV